MYLPGRGSFLSKDIRAKRIRGLLGECGREHGCTRRYGRRI